MSVRFFRRFARNNAWCNHRLYEACASLSHSELTTPRYSSFPTIMATLNHILVVDWYYLDMMRGEGFGLELHDLDLPFAEFEPLRAAQMDADREFIAFCDTLGEDDLSRVAVMRHGESASDERIEDLLSYLVHHQILHRGNVHAMLGSTHVAPPPLDEFFERHHRALRLIDFAALGWKGEEN